MLVIGKTFNFDAAHYLPSYEGKCRRMHGHTWHITVEVTGELNPLTHMIMDLHSLQDYVNIILEEFDHKVLNDTVLYPTCENVSTYVFNNLNRLLAPGVTVHSVKVQEGEGGYACLTLD